MKSTSLNTHQQQPSRSSLSAFKARVVRLLGKKLWLPTVLYEGLPVFYALAGIAAIGTTLFVSGWYWILPFCWLLGLLCLHASIYVWRLRRHYRRSNQASDRRDHKRPSQPRKSQLSQ